jgi:hypothetical protein
MSRAKNAAQQLVAIDLARGAREGCIAAYQAADTPISIKVAAILAATEELEEDARLHCARHCGSRLERGQPWEPSVAVYKAYKGINTSTQAILVERLGEKVDARMYLAAALEVIERVRDGIPRHPGNRWKTWFDLASALQMLMDTYPRAPRRVDRGVEIGEEIRRRVAA